MQPVSLTRFAWLSLLAAAATIALKLGAYLLTGSVGLLSDAVESLVNLVAALVALTMLAVAARPPDAEHPYGHGKAEYFSSGFEGGLILVAAIGIAATAIDRLLHPRPLEQIGLGLGISIAASLINLAVAIILLRAGRRYESITLEANARHLLTDVWTSAGVVAGVGAVALTGWQPLDPLIALLVAANIVRTGLQLLRRSGLGLLDTALPPRELGLIQAILARYQREGIQFHALRSRQAGARRFVSLHVLVPGAWSVQRSHHLLERIEREIREALPNTTVFTHVEPVEDPSSFQDTMIDRAERPRPAGGAAGEPGNSRPIR